MRTSGKITALILQRLIQEAKPGVKTKNLDALAMRLAKNAGAEPAFFGFDEYPASICVSVNEVAVHGLPNDYVLKAGDIVGIDFGVRYQGYCSDSATTVIIGNQDSVSREARTLLEVTERALYYGIAKAKARTPVGDIGAAIQEYVERSKFHVIRELVGHGIGTSLHEVPNVPNFGKRGSGFVLEKNMTIAIEPIVSIGSHAIAKSKDGFGYRTVDRSLTAHFEHTILITDSDPEILTKI